MASNPYVNKVEFGNQTVMDISDTTAEESDVLSGKTFYKASGARSTGTGTSGHTMIDNATYLSTMKTNSQDITDNKVASTYAISNWSNAEIVTLYTTIPKDTDTVGTWVDNWKDSGASRSGWLWHSMLHDILSDDEVEIEFVFDVLGEEVVSLYAYRVDDDVQNGGVDGGAIAIKLNGAIQNASGVKVAINLKRQRTQTGNLTVLS